MLFEKDFFFINRTRRNGKNYYCWICIVEFVKITLLFKDKRIPLVYSSKLYLKKELFNCLKLTFEIRKSSSEKYCGFQLFKSVLYMIESLYDYEPNTVCIKNVFMQLILIVIMNNISLGLFYFFIFFNSVWHDRMLAGSVRVQEFQFERSLNRRPTNIQYIN